MDRETLRTQELAATSPWYSPWLHLFGPSLFGLTVVAACAWGLEGVTAAQWLTVPITYVFANAGEWRIHRTLLHRRIPPFEWLYERHTLMHHRVYTPEFMELREPLEMRLVLIPPWAEVLLVVAAGVPAAVVWLVLGQNVARLFLATEVLYILSYEWLHLAFHLPISGPLGGIVAVLRRHHMAHHDPQNMLHNLNVTVPLWDWVRGTIRR